MVYNKIHEIIGSLNCAQKFWQSWSGAGVGCSGLDLSLMMLKILLEDLRNANQVFNVPSSQICRDQMIYDMESFNSKKVVLL